MAPSRKQATVLVSGAALCLVLAAGPLAGAGAGLVARFSQAAPRAAAAAELAPSDAPAQISRAPERVLSLERNAPAVAAPPGAARPVALRALVLDLTDPARPLPVELLRPTREGEQEWDLIVLGDVGYGLGRYGEFQVVHLGDPFENPLTTWDTSVAVVDQCLYLVAGDDGLRVVDLAAETDALLPTPGTAVGILVRDHYAYVALMQYPPAYSGYD